MEVINYLNTKYEVLQAKGADKVILQRLTPGEPKQKMLLLAEYYNLDKKRPAKKKGDKWQLTWNGTNVGDPKDQKRHCEKLQKELEMAGTHKNGVFEII